MCPGSHQYLCKDFLVSLQADERRAPLRTWANACGPIDRWQPVEVDESRMAPVKMETECRWVRFCPACRLHPTRTTASLIFTLVLTSIHIILVFHVDLSSWRNTVRV